MKVFAILAAATLAVVSAQAPECSADLITVVRGPDTAACQEATGYTPLSLSVPAGADLVKVCSNKSCQALLAAVNKAVPTECTYAGISVKATIIDPITKACASVASTPTTAPVATSAAPATTKPATTTAAPGATTAAPTATTKAPEATSAAPAATTATPKEEETSSASGSGGDIESPAVVTEAPAATKAAATTPAPAATKSSASSVVAAAGAVVVAVAASLF